MNNRGLVAALSAAFCLAMAPATVIAAPPAGQVLALNGQPALVSAGQRLPLKLGDAVGVGDSVEVPAGSKLKLRMNDGSVLSLAAGSQMTIKAYDVDGSGQRRDAQLSLPGGLLRAVVASVNQPAQFEVDTAVGTAAVRSTDWFIESRPGSAQVGVLAGTVDLTSLATRRTVAIPARWGARLEAGRDPVPPRVWAPAEFDDVIGRTNVN